MRTASRDRHTGSEPSIALPAEFVPGKVGVVTVTYNSAPVLDEFLESLERQTHADFILFAVDNASKDATVAQLEGWADPRLVMIPNGENVGVAAGNNQGIRAAIEAGCEYVLLLNNDVVFGPELFQQLIDGLAIHNCQMTTPLIYYHDKPDVIWAAGGHFQRWLGYRCLHDSQDEKDTGQYSRPRTVPHSPTCCVLMERHVFSKVGIMDERYFVYHDDTDFMLRAFKAGERMCLLPHAKLWHKVSSLTGKDTPFSIRYGTRNRAFYLGKHLGRIGAFPFGLFYKTYYLSRWLLRVDDRRIWQLKQSSWNEGAAIPGNILPPTYRWNGLVPSGKR